MISRSSSIYLGFKNFIRSGRLCSIRRGLLFLHILVHLPVLSLYLCWLSSQGWAVSDSSLNLSVNTCNLWDNMRCLSEHSVVIISWPCRFIFKISICYRGFRRVPKEVFCLEPLIVCLRRPMIMELRCWLIFRIVQLRRERQECLGNLCQKYRRVLLPKLRRSTKWRKV